MARLTKSTPAAAAEPVTEAAVERAEAERVADPVAGAADAAVVEGVAPIAPDPVDPPAPATGTTVLPEPTVVADPLAGEPLVTASPPLAAEPSAMDVVKATASPQPDPAPDRSGDHPVTLAQPTLAIEPAATAVNDAALAATGPAEQLPGAVDQSGDPLPPVETVRVEVVEIVGPRKGFRRGGFSFGPEKRQLLRASLTDAQFAAINREPMLAVVVREIEVDPAQPLIL